MVFNILYFPFTLIFASIKIVIAVLITIFWIWMIIDCIKRKFKSDTEKIIWIFVIVLLSWVGALIYYLQTTTGFWPSVVGILKALVWPAFVVYKLLGL